MKLNRLVKLKKAKSRCEVCGERAKMIHHIDESTDNHNMSNLLVVCAQCHKVLHANERIAREPGYKQRAYTSYQKKYGLTLREMAKSLNCSIGTVRLRLLDEKNELALLKELASL